MLQIVKKIIPVIILWSIFFIIVLNVSYPQSLIQADTAQVLLFFIPLLLAISFTLYSIIRNFFFGFSISLGLISLLILKALDILNLVTTALIIIVVGLLISYFKKIKKTNLTKLPKISKLTHMRKHNASS